MTRPGAGLFALGLMLGLLAACGKTGEPARAPRPRAGTPSDPATPVIPAEQPPLLIEYVVIHRRWVEKLVPVTSADVKTWGESPENTAGASGAFRHILVKVTGGENDQGIAAKKKAQAILARLEKGEDFAKVARQVSEDAGSKDNGGEYPKEKLEELPPVVSAAFKGLEPGKTTSAPLRSALGFHIVHKDRASEDRIEEAYRAAKAPEIAKELADQLRSKLTGTTPARAAIADAVEAVLGERGVNDAERPTPQAIPRARVQHVRLPAAAKAALEAFARSAHAGDVLPSPAVDGDRILVARALAPDTR